MISNQTWRHHKEEAFKKRKRDRYKQLNQGDTQRLLSDALKLNYFFFFDKTSQVSTSIK